MGFGAELFGNRDAWQLYTQPLDLQTMSGATLAAKAVRYGYAESAESSLAIE